MLIKQGNIVRAIEGSEYKFDAGIYALEYDSNHRCYYLARQSDFVVPQKLYGLDGIEQDCKRWLDAFNRARKNIGISLTGLKGSGKSLTAQYLCATSKLPVILISKSINGKVEEFLSFMNKPEFKGSIVFIDEFEKVFGKEDSRDDSMQQSEAEIVPLLQLMDGNYSTHFLFLLTSNRELHYQFSNRLGRIRFRKNYFSLDTAVVENYLSDALIPERQTQIESILDIINKLGFATYDFLNHYVDELNHCGESPMECLNMLNITPSEKQYDIAIREKNTDTWYNCESEMLNIFLGRAHVYSLSFYRGKHVELPEKLSNFSENVYLSDYNLTAEGGIINFGEFEIRFLPKVEKLTFGAGGVFSTEYEGGVSLL